MTSASPCRVIVIEDHDATRQSLCRLLAASGDLAVVGSAADHDEAWPLLRRPFDLALVDLSLGDRLALDLIRDIASQPDRHCLVLTVFGDEASVMAAIGAGADGYVLKDSTDIVAAVRETVAGGAPLSPGIARFLLRHLRSAPGEAAAGEAALSPLTPRESQVLESLARGSSYRETAAALGVSYNTVSDHIKAIYRKLAVNSRGEAVFTAMAQGLIRLKP
jgi:DNA-binding NarL/FixJ family response regulator